MDLFSNLVLYLTEIFSFHWIKSFLYKFCILLINSVNSYWGSMCMHESSIKDVSYSKTWNQKKEVLTSNIDKFSNSSIPLTFV